MRRNCIALQNGEALLFPRQPHLCAPFHSRHLLYIYIYIYTYHAILINFRSTEESWKKSEKKKKKDPRFTLDRIHRGMDAEGEETSEIAIKRMTKQKKEKKKKGGRNRRRGDPVVINGTRSMRKHYVIDEESGASVRAPFSNLPLQFHSTDFPRGGRHLGLLKTAQKREEARLLAGETHEILRGRTRFKTL